MNQIVETTTQMPKIVDFFKKDDIMEKFEHVLWRGANTFIASLLSIVHSDKFKDVNPVSVYTAAMTAASFKLAINPNLWLAYIIPYNKVAQFQIWYKWLIQLCHRTKQFIDIDAKEVFEWQYAEDDSSFSWFKLKWSWKTSDKIIWYAAYMELDNWFKKTYYMTAEEVEAHAKKYSKTYNFADSTWKKDFAGMAKKTVLKLMISKRAPLSTEIEQAIVADQSADTGEWLEYVDNDKNTHENNELYDRIVECKSIEELEALKDDIQKSKNSMLVKAYAQHKTTLEKSFLPVKSKKNVKDTVDISEQTQDGGPLSSEGQV